MKNDEKLITSMFSSLGPLQYFVRNLSEGCQYMRLFGKGLKAHDNKACLQFKSWKRKPAISQLFLKRIITSKWA